MLSEDSAPRTFVSFGFRRLSRQILIMTAAGFVALASSAAATAWIVHMMSVAAPEIARATLQGRPLPLLPPAAPRGSSPANPHLAQLDPGFSSRPTPDSLAQDLPAQEALPAKTPVSPLPARPPASASPPKSPVSPPLEAAPLPPPRPIEFTSPAGPFDRWTAIYDLTAHTVYMPDGTKLEAHSGLGDRLDDPHHVDEKDRGATPPHVYELTPREELFHGVQALRLNPIGGGDIFGRDGLLAHSYMLGPNGDSNGCVSFKNYDAFLQAFQNGNVKRLAVVASRN
jgi:type VI secretion system (T6SS) effector TldE1-like protein